MTPKSDSPCIFYQQWNITSTLLRILYISNWTSSKPNILHSSNLNKFRNQIFLHKCFSSCTINQSSIDLWGCEPKQWTLWTIRLTNKQKTKNKKQKKGKKKKDIAQTFLFPLRIDRMCVINESLDFSLKKRIYLENY